VLERRGHTELYPGIPRPLRRSVIGPMAASLAVVLLVSVSSFHALDIFQCPPSAQDVGQDAHALLVTVASFVVSPARVYVGEEMTFFLNASSDRPGSTVNITIYFDYLLSDGTTVNPYSPVFVTSVTGAPVNITTTYTYDHIGNLTGDEGTYFQVRAFLNDGDGNTTRRSVQAYVVENTAPTLGIPSPSSIISPTYGVPYNVAFVVKDWDSELVTVTWDFGDGTEPALNETIATPAGSYVCQSHTWVVVLEPGRDQDQGYYILFNMSVSFEDSYGHVKYSNHTVNITPPENDYPSVTFSSESMKWSPGVALPFFASAVDDEGDPLTWTFVFNDSVENYLTVVYHTNYTDPATVMWQNVSHTFDTVGDYRVTLYVSDALIPYQVGVHNYSQTIPVSIRENQEPGVSANITMSPVKPVINSTIGYVDIVFFIWAGDPDGDILYLDWDFGDGESAQNQSKGEISSALFTQTHRYSVAGLYNVSVLVDDNRGHKILRYKQISVLTDNGAPRITLASFQLSDGAFARPGTTVNLTLAIADRERDPITLWVSFGDNTSVVRLDLTDFSENNTVTAKLSHVYQTSGKFKVAITYTDWVYGSAHNATLNLTVEVKVPRVLGVRVWDWWDYTSLLLLVAGFGVVFARWMVLGRFRKELDNIGLTFEEYKTITTEFKSKRDAALEDVDAQVKQTGLSAASAKKMKAQIREDYAQRRKDLRERAKAETVRETR
jgi:hypothetical protein